ncbi:hypothetical protein Dimus_038523 [Dionaea muscipula]
MSSACSEITWLRALMSELGFPQTRPTPLHADNTSAIKITANPVYHKRTKLIEVDCHSIREAFCQQQINLPHISSNLQVADILTKALLSETLNDKHTLYFSMSFESLLVLNIYLQPMSFIPLGNSSLTLLPYIDFISSFMLSIHLLELTHSLA